MLKEKLKEYRMLCEYSQQQVADCLNIHRSTYSYYELGKTEPSLDNICTLASIFGGSLYDLLEVNAAPAPTGLFDGGLKIPDDEEAKAIDKIESKTGDLSRDERMLIMRYRMLTEAQRKNLLDAMSDTHGQGFKDD